MTTRTLLAFVCWQANQVKTQLVPSEYTAVELEEGDLLILDPMLMHSSSQNAVRKEEKKRKPAELFHSTFLLLFLQRLSW
jgi:ectoine hydroxylase-related dioxygenase (phytanoyl-CoA dioxygenase family)